MEDQDLPPLRLPARCAAPTAMFHDTIGFYAIQGLQRLPFPLTFHGALRPSKLIEFYIPLILVLGLALWAVTMAVAVVTNHRAPRASATMRGGIAAQAQVRPPEAGAWSLTPMALVGLGYLLGRTDEFHLIPLAAVLPVMLAWAAPAARGLTLRLALIAALTLIVAHGLECRAGQLLHLPALAAVPGPAGDGVQTDPVDARSWPLWSARLRSSPTRTSRSLWPTPASISSTRAIHFFT